MLKIKAVKCLICNHVIYSRHRHDFRYCPCKNTAIDGGFDYVKISGENWEGTDIEIDVSKEILLKDYADGVNNYGVIRPNGLPMEENNVPLPPMTREECLLKIFDEGEKINFKKLREINDG